MERILKLSQLKLHALNATILNVIGLSLRQIKVSLPLSDHHDDLNTKRLTSLVYSDDLILNYISQTCSLELPLFIPLMA